MWVEITVEFGLEVLEAFEEQDLPILQAPGTAKIWVNLNHVPFMQILNHVAVLHLPAGPVKTTVPEEVERLRAYVQSNQI